jgi:hypothetical protein
MIPISSRSGQAQKQWIERVQKRLAVTANVLGNMKAVQMLGLNDVLLPLVSHLRQVEVKTSVRFRKLLIWQVALCKSIKKCPQEMNLRIIVYS